MHIMISSFSWTTLTVICCAITSSYSNYPYYASVQSFSIAVVPSSQQLQLFLPARTLSTSTTTSSRLYNVIRPESVDFDFDVGQGGVRLAEESVIKLTGTVSLKSISEPTITNLIRYTKLVTIDDEQLVVNTMQQIGATILAAGRGKELYSDPGTTTNQIIQYGPIEAVKDSLVGAKVVSSEYTNIVINFCGGDDTQVLEVLSAISKLIENLNIVDKAKTSTTNISFNSISHSTFPLGTSSVTVIGLTASSSESNDSESNKIVSAIKSGEIYFREGIFYTVMDEDINPAIA